MVFASATKAAADFWAGILPEVPNTAGIARVQALIVEADARRARADYNTGSISEAEAYYLWALAQARKARVVIEVGTFIGTSTTALALADSVEAVYTCDASNDCLPATPTIHPYPKRTSIDMLQDLVWKEVVADLCFFDGVLTARDVDLLARVTHPRTVYAFHDYNYGPKIRQRHGKTTLETMPRKGIGNVGLIYPRCLGHDLIDPLPESTLALLVPR